MDWKLMFVSFSSLLGLVFSRGYIYFDQRYRFIGEKAKGSWTRWFNSDNPFIYDAFAPGGDIETIVHQQRTYGYHCDWGVPCRNPIGFEADLSHFWRFLYPASNLTKALECTNLSPTALTEIGKFECSNLAQLNQAWENSLPQSCFDYCQRAGQMYYGQQDPRWALNVLPNCRVCPDFSVRFFCLDVEKDCLSKSEFLEWYYSQLGNTPEQNVG